MKTTPHSAFLRMKGCPEILHRGKLLPVRVRVWVRVRVRERVRRQCSLRAIVLEP